MLTNLNKRKRLQCVSGQIRPAATRVKEIECFRRWQTTCSLLKQEDLVMAKLIPFYVPRSFHKKVTAPSELQKGKVIEFCATSRKSA